MSHPVLVSHASRTARSTVNARVTCLAWSLPFCQAMGGELLAAGCREPPHVMVRYLGAVAAEQERGASRLALRSRAPRGRRVRGQEAGGAYLPHEG